jgi:hypothetical protein
MVPHVEVLVAHYSDQVDSIMFHLGLDFPPKIKRGGLKPHCVMGPQHLPDMPLAQYRYKQHNVELAHSRYHQLWNIVLTLVWSDVETYFAPLLLCEVFRDYV